jgi:hypothetical protein
VGGDGPGGQEQAVGDLGVGQALAGQQDDLALLRGQVRERVGRGDRGLGGDAAGAQLCLGALGPGNGAQAAEGFQGRREDGLGVVDAALPAKPFTVVELELGPFEWPGAADGVG